MVSEEMTNRVKQMFINNAGELRLLAKKKMMRISIKIISGLSLLGYCYGIDSLISEDIYYDCINIGVIPNIVSITDSEVFFSTTAIKTVYRPIGDWLYLKSFRYLEKELGFHRKDINYMKKQLKDQKQNLKWDKERIRGIQVLDNENSYIGYYFSKPVVSKEEDVFIIIRYVIDKPDGRCGTVVNKYMPMVFQKERGSWKLKQTFPDPTLQ